MANDVNILCVKYVNMPNTIFKATKAEEEKKISLRVIFRNKKNPPMQTTARKRPADMSIHRVLSDDIPPAVFIIPCVYMMLANFILEKIFQKYMSPEDLEAEKERNMEYFN